MTGELAALINRLDNNQINTTPFLHLIDAVMQKASDIEIWKLVLQLIVSTSRITPPPRKPSYGGTPRSYNSASHSDFEQTKKLLEGALRDEFWECSYIMVQGFFEKYFDGKSWTEQGKDIFNSVKHEHVDGRWMSFPNPPTESAVWQWWSNFQDKHLNDLHGLYYMTKNKHELTGVDAEAQLDLLVKSRNKPSSDPHDWADVCVVGEHTVSKGGSKFLQLARYARNIFLAQPRRRFLHGFTLCDTSMELHVFDRSGAYSAEQFDLHRDPERFIRAISGYCLMNDEELGLDTFVQCDGAKEFITVIDNTTGEDRRLQMETLPIAHQRAVVGRATSCFRTTDHNNVVKFSWVSANRWLTEPDLLKAAREKNVKGVARLISYKRIASTGELRTGLAFSRKRQMQSRLRKSGALFSGSQLATMPLSDEAEFVEKKRKPEDPGDGSSAKKSRSNSQTLRLSQASQAVRPVSDHFIDRVLSCLVVSPAGRPLDKFTSVTELLQALRDAIQAHRSLSLVGKILHRDISQNNIIITDRKETGGFSGMLIDLDLATTIDENGKNTRTHSQRMTGTLKFMAIEVVELAYHNAKLDLEHTYRHDLESFFYVFLSMCVSYGWCADKKTEADPFQNWYIGSHKDIVFSKRGGMERGGFQSILNEFSPIFQHVKGLAMTLRDALFRLNATLHTGTPREEPSVLYNQMISAFDSAIEAEERKAPSP